jgi:hypothetical protein
VSQPLVLGHQQPGSVSRSQHHAHLRPQAPHLAAAGSTPRASSAASGLLRLRTSLGGGQQQHHHQLQQHLAASTSPSATAVDTMAAADQVPSPLAILEFPPELEQQQGLPGMMQQGHHHQQQQHRTLMSGRRVNARYDIPLGFDW